MLARYTGVGADRIYAAAAKWADAALRSDGSLFTPDRRIWSLPNLEDIRPRIAQDLAPGSNYRTAMAAQRSGAPQATVQLYEEALYFYFRRLSALDS